MKSLFLLLGVLTVLSSHAAAPDPIELRIKRADSSVSVTAYLPDKAIASGAGVVIVPGGSFLIRCEDHEGQQVARWFNARGIAAFVAHYRLIPQFTMREELDDVRFVVQSIRARASEFNLKKIGVIGFSAGAYLAGETALKPASDGRPDFLVLVYGAPGGTNDPINGFNRYFAEQLGGAEKWRELTATTLEQIAKAPPTFMFCTMQDRGAARRMGELHLQFLQQGASCEAHFFASGPHGVGFAQGDPTLGAWPDLLHNWMRAKEFLAFENTIPIAGIVKLEGKPLELGYATFTPREKSNPTRTAYVFNRSGERGSFQLLQGEGLVPGQYDVTVHQMAAKWNSVWAEPLLNRIQTKLNAGEKLSESEIADWKNWAASREYKPTLPDLVHHQPIALAITKENANSLAIDVIAHPAGR